MKKTADTEGEVVGVESALAPATAVRKYGPGDSPSGELALAR